MLPLVMDATEGLETAVLADVTAVTAETLLVESDCITGEEQETVRTIKEKKKTSSDKQPYSESTKHLQAIRLIFSKPGLWDHCLVFARAQAVCPEGPTF